MKGVSVEDSEVFANVFVLPSRASNELPDEKQVQPGISCQGACGRGKAGRVVGLWLHGRSASKFNVSGSMRGNGYTVNPENQTAARE